MTVRRPLNFTANSLKELSDSHLQMLAYLVRKAYAYKMLNDSSYSGYLQSSSGTGFTSIGYFPNTYRVARSRTNPDVNTYPPDPDDQQSDFADTSTNVYTSYQYLYQRQGIPAWPDNATHDSYGYLYYDTTLDALKYASIEDDIKDTILTTALNKLQDLDGNQDGVGSYAVATSLGGDYSQHSTPFADSRYGSTIYYRLYVKMKDSSYESNYGSMNVPIIRWDGSSFKEISIDINNPQNNSLISNVLLPGFARIAPKYVVSAFYNNYNTKGVMIDTRYTGSTFSVSGPSGGLYTGTFTPSGTITTSVRYLNLVPR